MPTVPSLFFVLLFSLVLVGFVVPASFAFGKVIIGPDGIRQTNMFSTWNARWSEIAAWSRIKVEPYKGGSARDLIFLRKQDDAKVLQPYDAIVFGKRIDQVYSMFKKYAGPSSVGSQTVIPESIRRGQWVNLDDVG